MNRSCLILFMLSVSAISLFAQANDATAQWKKKWPGLQEVSIHRLLILLEKSLATNIDVEGYDEVGGVTSFGKIKISTQSYEYSLVADRGPTGNFAIALDDLSGKGNYVRIVSSACIPVDGMIYTYKELFGSYAILVPTTILEVSGKLIEKTVNFYPHERESITNADCTVYSDFQLTTEVDNLPPNTQFTILGYSMQEDKARIRTKSGKLGWIQVLAISGDSGVPKYNIFVK